MCPVLNNNQSTRSRDKTEVTCSPSECMARALLPTVSPQQKLKIKNHGISTEVSETVSTVVQSLSRILLPWYTLPTRELSHTLILCFTSAMFWSNSCIHSHLLIPRLAAFFLHLLGQLVTYNLRPALSAKVPPAWLPLALAIVVSTTESLFTPSHSRSLQMLVRAQLSLWNLHPSTRSFCLMLSL